MNAQPQRILDARTAALHDGSTRLEPIAAAFTKGALARQGLTDLGHELNRVFQLVDDAQEGLRAVGVRSEPVMSDALQAAYREWKWPADEAPVGPPLP